MDADRSDGAEVSRTDDATRKRIGWPFLALCGFLALLCTATVVVGVMWNQARATQGRYDEVLASARAEALAFTTLNHKTLDADIDRVLAGSTGSFRKQFESSKAQLKELSTENESVSKGKVLSAGVVSSDRDSARVVVVADSTVSNVNATSPQPRHYRIQMDLVLHNGHWLTSDLQFVS